MPNASLTYVSWVRQGAASAIAVDDGPTAGAVATVSAKLALNGAALADVPIRLRGPADVLGVDPNQVIRTDPRPGAIDFESNCFPAIEFDRADFPWLFTPTRGNAAHQLRPWLCLVVVAKQVGVSVDTPPGAPLPVLHIAGPAKPGVELPDLKDSWAWAHAQVAATDAAGTNNVVAALNGGSELSLSRLICPRLLAPNTDYVACVVPTFDIGRLTGLGKPVTEDDLKAADALKPAWLSGPAAPIEVSLPVYYRWEFRTGDGGDFQSIASALRPDAPPGLGLKTIDIGKPGFDAAGATTTALQGALMPVTAPDPGAPPPATFQTNLAAILNAPGLAEKTTGATPILAPPIYGRWHAGRAAVGAPAGSAWLDQLNLDPRWRVTAAYGTKVVQTHQEALMASAWDQAGDLPAANQRLRQLQMSRAVGESFHGRHFDKFDDEMMARVAAPAFGRVGLDQGKSMLAVQAQSPLPMGANGVAMRRIGRVRGPISRRVAAQREDRAETPTWVARMMTAAGPPDPPVTPPSPAFAVWPGVPTPHLDADSYWGAFFVTPELQPLPFIGEATPVTGRQDLTELPGYFRAAARTHLAAFFPARPPKPTPPPTPDLTGVADDMLQHLEPKAALSKLAAAIIATGDNVLSPAAHGVEVDGLETVMAAPSFPAPMYQGLRDLSQDLLIPGLETVLPETVLGLQTNRRFVESYMVGLNHEMGRELLWRGFPTDQRGTYFSHFWGVGDTVAKASDVDDLAGWRERPLGATAQAQDEKFVMLLRSRLLARYPNAIIYMTPATGPAAALTPVHDTAREVPPTFSGDLKPDLVFFGFPVKPDTATGKDGSLGHYVVIQEHSTEARFGIDFGAAPAGQSHLIVGGALPKNKTAWGGNAGAMAGLFRRRPARVAIHAKRLIAQA